MRFLVHVSFPPEKFNAAVRDGTAGGKIGRIMDDLKPEAAYFTTEDGCRGGIMVVNVNDASEMPRIAEPFFLLFDARVEFTPTMTPADLQKSGLESLGAKWR